MTQPSNLSYEKILDNLKKIDPRICIDADQCKCAICALVVRVLIVCSQGSGWGLMWALHIHALNVSFEELFSRLNGAAIAWIECAFHGWKTSDATDYTNAMRVYRECVEWQGPPDADDDGLDAMLPPILLPPPSE